MKWVNRIVIVLPFIFAFYTTGISQNYTFPVNGKSTDDFTSAFGPRNKTANHQEYPDVGYDYDFHAAIDIDGDAGTHIFAVAPGYAYARGNIDSKNEYIVLKHNDELGDYFTKYYHVVPVSHLFDGTEPAINPDTDEPWFINQGEMIALILDYGASGPSGDHLDIRYFYNQEDYERPHDNGADNPGIILEGINTDPSPRILDKNGSLINNTSSVYLEEDNHTVHDNQQGKFFKFAIESEDTEFDIDLVEIQITAYAYDGTYYWNDNSLLNTTRNPDYEAFQVNYPLRINCGDDSYKDSDVGHNSSSVGIYPREFTNGTDDYHTVYFRWYVNETIWETLDPSLTYIDVNVQDWAGNTANATLRYTTTGIGGGPSGSPNPPNLISATYINQNKAIQLKWEPANSGYSADYYRIYRCLASENISDNDFIAVCNYNQQNYFYFDDYSDDLVPGVSYKYVVAGVNEIGEGSNSNEQSELFGQQLGSTISANTTLTGAYYSDGTIIMGNSTLTINPGTNIYIAEGKKIIVEDGSKIIANGTENENIKFFRLNSDQSWDRIQLNGDGNEFEWCTFDGGTYNVDIRSRNNTFSHCTFKNASRGVNAYKRSDNSWSSFSLDNCLLENNHYGVVAFYTYGAINNCTSRNNTSYGIGLYNARIGNDYAGLSGLFTDNLIQNNGGLGLSIQHNGKLWLGYGTTPGNNKIVNNGDHEISIYSSETARLYEATNGGYGSIYDDSGYFIYNLGKTWEGEQYVLVEVSAENNYWGGTWTGSDGENYTGPVAAQFYGPVDYTPYLSSDPTGTPGGSGFPSRVPPGNSDTQPVVADNNIHAALNSVSGAPEPTGENDDVSVKIQALEDEIKSAPNNPNNAAKLNEMYNLQIDEDPDRKSGSKDNTMSMLADYRNSLMQLDEKSASANPDSATAVRINGEISMVLEMYDSNNLQNYKQTLELADKYDSYVENSDSRREFLALKLTAYESTGQYEQALKVLDELKAEVKFDYKYYSAPSYEVIEQNLCEQLGKPYLAKTDGSAADFDSVFLDSAPDKYALHANYPNPFNPLTSIPFSILAESRVKLEVYNTLGQKVATLTDKTYQAGNHLLQFNAQGLSSGIYFIVAQIKTLDSPSSNYVFNHKMILLK